jgi:hypothetical protein
MGEAKKRGIGWWRVSRVAFERPRGCALQESWGGRGGRAEGAARGRHTKCESLRFPRRMMSRTACAAVRT